MLHIDRQTLHGLPVAENSVWYKSCLGAVSSVVPPAWESSRGSQAHRAQEFQRVCFKRTSCSLSYSSMHSAASSKRLLTYPLQTLPPDRLNAQIGITRPGPAVVSVQLQEREKNIKVGLVVPEPFLTFSTPRLALQVGVRGVISHGRRLYSAFTGAKGLGFAC